MGLRRHPWLLVALALPLAVAAIALAASWSTPRSKAHSPSHRDQSPVTLELRLERTTLRPGRNDAGVAVVTNHSGHLLHMRDCLNRRGLVAGLVSPRVAYLPGPPLRHCQLIRSIPPGVTTLPTWVATTYQRCGTPGTPRCNGIAPIDLPAGTYHVRFPLAGLPRATRVVLPSVTVLPPAWLTALHGSEGSLLIAASPCDPGPLETPVTAGPRVDVVVVHRGHVVSRRSLAFPGGTFSVSLAPGHYVVRSRSAHRTAEVTVLRHRQTVANLRSECY